jgi:hypothetical protein
MVNKNIKAVTEQLNLADITPTTFAEDSFILFLTTLGDTKLTKVASFSSFLDVIQNSIPGLDNLVSTVCGVSPVNGDVILTSTKLYSILESKLESTYLKVDFSNVVNGIDFKTKTLDNIGVATLPKQAVNLQQMQEALENLVPPSGILTVCNQLPDSFGNVSLTASMIGAYTKSETTTNISNAVAVLYASNLKLDSTPDSITILESLNTKIDLVENPVLNNILTTDSSGQPIDSGKFFDDNGYNTNTVWSAEKIINYVGNNLPLKVFATQQDANLLITNGLYLSGANLSLLNGATGSGSWSLRVEVSNYYIKQWFTSANDSVWYRVSTNTGDWSSSTWSRMATNHDIDLNIEAFKETISVTNPYNLYVDNNTGSDTNTGTSIYPFATITKALSVIDGGLGSNVIINVVASPEYVENLHITDLNNTEVLILSLSGNQTITGHHIISIPQVTFKGFNFVNSSSNSLFIINDGYLGHSFIDCQFTNGASGNFFDISPSTSGFQITYGLGDIIFKNCKINGNTSQNFNLISKTADTKPVTSFSSEGDSSNIGYFFITVTSEAHGFTDNQINNYFILKDTTGIFDCVGVLVSVVDVDNLVFQVQKQILSTATSNEGSIQLANFLQVSSTFIPTLTAGSGWVVVYDNNSSINDNNNLFTYMWAGSTSLNVNYPYKTKAVVGYFTSISDVVKSLDLKISDLSVLFNNYYTKTDTDTKFYTKTYIDDNLYTKTNIDSTFYTKNAVDTTLTNYYDKTNIDSKLAEYPKTNTINETFILSKIGTSGIINVNLLPADVYSQYISVNDFASLPTIGEALKVYILNDTKDIYIWLDNAYVKASSTQAVSNLSASLTTLTENYSTLNTAIDDINTDLTTNYVKNTALTTSLNDYYKKTEIDIKITDINTAIGTKESTLPSGSAGQFLANDKTFKNVTKSDVGLSNVDNTTDLQKPISSAVQTELDKKINNTLSSGRILVGSPVGNASPVDMSGDVTINNAGLTTLTDSVVSNNKLANAPAKTLKGNKSNETGTLNDLTVSEVNALLGIAVNTIYVTPNGSDTNNGFSPENGVATLGKALFLLGNISGTIFIHPKVEGYSENLTITKQNINIVALSSNLSVYFTGSITVSNQASSVSFRGIGFTNLVHSGAGSLYLRNCSVTNSLSKTGTGYLFVLDSDLQATSNTISITGSGQVVFSDSTLLGVTTINNATAVVTITNCLNSLPILLTLGVLGINNTPVYSLDSISNSINAIGGYLYITNSNFIIAGTTNSALINISSGVSYSVENCVYSSSSTINGTLVSRKAIFDQIKLLIPLEIASGGTGAVTKNDALNNLLPLQTGNNGKALFSNGTDAYWNTVSGGTTPNAVYMSSKNQATTNVSTIQNITNATGSSSWTTPASLSNRLNINSNVIQTAGFTVNSNNIVISNAGTYRISINLNITNMVNLGTNMHMYTQLVKNNTFVAVSENKPSNVNDYTSNVITVLIECLAGDILDFRCMGGSGTPDIGISSYTLSIEMVSTPSNTAVNSVSGVTANGVTVNVNNPNTTPEIIVGTNVTGILYGDGIGINQATPQQLKTAIGATSTSTPEAVVLYDTRSNLRANNYIADYVEYTDVVGTIILTGASPRIIRVLGTTDQIVRLPNPNAEASVPYGCSFEINNLGTGTIIVENASGSDLITILPGSLSRDAGDQSGSRVFYNTGKTGSSQSWVINKASVVGEVALDAYVTLGSLLFALSLTGGAGLLVKSVSGSVSCHANGFRYSGSSQDYSTKDVKNINVGTSTAVNIMSWSGFTNAKNSFEVNIHETTNGKFYKVNGSINNLEYRISVIQTL